MPNYDIGHILYLLKHTTTTEFYTLSLHDALPISTSSTRSTCPRSATRSWRTSCSRTARTCRGSARSNRASSVRSEEHTSELQSRRDLVCRLLLEKKKNISIASEYVVYSVYTLQIG